MCYSDYFFCLQPQKGSENTTKRRRLSKEEIQKQLIDSIINNDIIETEELKKKNITSKAYHQGKVFKIFRDKEKFIKLVNDFKVHKSSIIFKTNIFKVIDNNPKLMKSSVTLGFLKNHHQDIKQICNKNSNEFE